MPGGPDTHECPASGCARSVDWDKLMCPFHWQMVPPELRTDVLETWRYGAGDAAYLTAREAAITAVNDRPGTSADLGDTTLFGPVEENTDGNR